ncbi:MAG: CotH kinase family protein [Verrucomicrobiales bacterium]
MTQPPVTYVPAGSESWRYRKALSEASSPDTAAWRFPAFPADDGTWLTSAGGAPFGYGDVVDTVLADMRGGYSGIYLRHTFELTGSLAGPLRLRVYNDDGFIAWLNGVEVARFGPPEGEFVPYNGFAGRNHESTNQPPDEVTIAAPNAILQQGTNVLAIHALNVDLGGSLDSFVDAIHHYDIGDGNNYFYYHDPLTAKWKQLPWDLDLTWSDNMYGGGAGIDSIGDSTEPFLGRIFGSNANTGGIAPLKRELRNRARELLDLLINTEQTGMLIDEMASRIYQPDQPSFVDADRAMWDYNPILVEYSLGSIPTDATSVPRVEAVIETVDNANFLMLTFSRRLGADQAVVVPQVSHGLDSWNSSAAAVTLVHAQPNGDGTVTLIYRSLTPMIIGQREFLRLRVTGRGL